MSSTHGIGSSRHPTYILPSYITLGEPTNPSGMGMRWVAPSRVVNGPVFDLPDNPHRRLNCWLDDVIQKNSSSSAVTVCHAPPSSSGIIRHRGGRCTNASMSSSVSSRISDVGTSVSQCGGRKISCCSVLWRKIKSFFFRRR